MSVGSEATSMIVQDDSNDGGMVIVDDPHTFPPGLQLFELGLKDQEMGCF